MAQIVYLPTTTDGMSALRAALAINKRTKSPAPDAAAINDVDWDWIGVGVREGHLEIRESRK